MVEITRGDLQYKDYEWTTIAGDDPRISGKPDSTFLNRKEGYEMLYFINKYLEEHELDEQSAEKAELMIREKLPGDIRSQEKVKAWLEENWEKYRLQSDS